MEIEQYFKPVPEDFFKEVDRPDQNQIAFKLTALEKFYNEEAQVDLAIIGVPEDRGSLENKGCAESVEDIRRSFYKLYDHNELRIVDLGDIVPGHTIHARQGGSCRAQCGRRTCIFLYESS